MPVAAGQRENVAKPGAPLGCGSGCHVERSPRSSAQHPLGSVQVAPRAANPGAIPIGRPYVVGVIGVAGGIPEQDEQCCRAAVTGS